MKKFWKEFKEFISKGNILDLAVAVVIGAAFGKIVSSLVNDIVMPLISLATGGTDVTDWKWVISKQTSTKAEVALRYGNFIQSIIDFLIIALFVFIAIKIVMRIKNSANKIEEKIKKKMKKNDTAVVVKPTTDELLVEIRDILKNNNKPKSQHKKTKENPIEK